MSEKLLELFLRKFHSYTFRNNVELETVLYLTNGRKEPQKRRPLGSSFYCFYLSTT